MVGFRVPRVALALWHDQQINTRLVEDALGTEVRARRDASVEWCSAANCIPRTCDHAGSSCFFNDMR